MRPQELFRKHKVAISTVRRYEAEGLLPERDPSRGWRAYSTQDFERVAFICGARAMGFTLNEIRAFAASDPPTIPQDRVREMVRRYTARRGELTCRIDRLRSYTAVRGE